MLDHRGDQGLDHGAMHGSSIWKAAKLLGLSVAAGSLLTACGSGGNLVAQTGGELGSNAVAAAARTQQEFREYWAKKRQEAAQKAAQKAESSPRTIADSSTSEPQKRRANFPFWWGRKQEPRTVVDTSNTPKPEVSSAPEPDAKRRTLFQWWGKSGKGEPDEGDDELAGIDLSGDFPTASPVTDWDGFVRSPYNDRFIDVKGVASGTLVADPRYDLSERKFFIVP